MLTTPEAKAHIALIGLLDAVTGHPKKSDARRMASWHLFNECWGLLPRFAARCNCGKRLVFSPWVNGLRSARCNWCGAGWREAPLHGG